MKLSRAILKTFGWTLIGKFPNIKKSVVVMAPHTSYWDFVIGKLYLNAIFLLQPKGQEKGIPVGKKAFTILLKKPMFQL